MSFLVQIIQNCLSPNNSLRMNAEKELLKLCDQNLYQILSEFCNFISNDDTPSNVRQFCGTFIKHIFSTEQYISIWNKFSQEQNTFIKNNLLGSLASELDDTKKTCSLAIAALAKVEIPKGWNIIEVICNAAIHQNINYKITSLITLQNILDFIGKNLKVHEKQRILGVLTTDMSINEPVQVINEAIIGYYKILLFIEENFQNEKERNFMLNLLLNLLEPNYINKVNLSEEIQKNILIVFIEIVKNYAFHIQNDFLKIANMTFRYFNCNIKILSVLSIELWSTLCDEEQMIKKNIISSNYQDTLNECILRVIQTRDDYSFEEIDEWTPTKAAVALISGLVIVGNKKISDRMLKYISECLNSEIVKKFDSNFQNLSQKEKVEALIIKENAFLSYRGILYSKDIDSEVILSSLTKIVSELKNKENIPIGKSISICLAIICKVHFYLINDNEKMFNDFIIEVLKLLELHISNKQILKGLLLAMKHIIKNAHPEYFNRYLTNIINILMKIAYDKNSYDKDNNLTSTSMFLTGKIIEICEDSEENKNIIQLFFSNLYTLFENSLNIKNFSTQEEAYCYQNSLLSLISSCGGEFQKITMNANQIKCVYDLIDKCLLQRGCLFEEALYALGSLAFFGWELFSIINDDVMKYILFSLDEQQNYQLCYQGLLAADDVIRCVGAENIAVIPKIVEKIQKIIKEPNFPRGLKIKCFPLYNDIFMIPSKSNGDYLNEVLNLIKDGMNTSVNLPNKDTDQETLEYLSELREKIIELLTGVFMFLTEQNQTNVFSNYIDGFLKYLSKIVEPEFNSDIQIISEVCGLLGDLYTHFKASVELYFNPNSLKIIYERLEHSDNPQHLEVLNYTRQIMNNFCKN